MPRPAMIEADSSDRAEGSILSQLDDEGVLRFCAFFSRKLTAAELNYEIYDKELMCNVDAFKEWLHHLEGSGHQAKVYLDHKNLQWFTETKRYNHHQGGGTITIRFCHHIPARKVSRQTRCIVKETRLWVALRGRIERSHTRKSKFSKQVSQSRSNRQICQIPTTWLSDKSA
jgi:RNase H-like domain found in reverse transcriptase